MHCRTLGVVLQVTMLVGKMHNLLLLLLLLYQHVLLGLASDLLHGACSMHRKGYSCNKAGGQGDEPSPVVQATVAAAGSAAA